MNTALRAIAFLSAAIALGGCSAKVLPSLPTPCVSADSGRCHVTFGNAERPVWRRSHQYGRSIGRRGTGLSGVLG